MKKGFTLIEMIAVVLILSLLCILAIPKLLTSINNTKKDISTAMEQILFNATNLYLTEQTHPKIEGNVYCVKIETLIQNELLTVPLKDPVTQENIPFNYFIKIEINGGSYDYKYTKTCQEIK